ncbi:small, acid-soluble spore protein L [Calidifontibacillus erzurumensis]|uniref:Small, acid-soluble spore protein L n=1 Tax=Calidifontibacillus erzurumensis TaxID=2741433 RepID=A0A8J8GGD1_9BACI|nr:small, acid-soluble spore protein L [Calidifontibacillus erzurumensis]NSL52646.1 small, acid-soluble spore protein L [Calidifontibacillus erzurumensis]
MAKENNRGKAVNPVNKQGHAEEGVSPNPKSQLEQKAQKDNTKI